MACGSPCGTRRVEAIAFVPKSTAATSASTGQNSPALFLCIFLALLAVDAIAGVREGVQPLESNFVTALMAFAESFRRPIQAAKGFVDVPQETTFLTREQKRLLALHRVGS